MLPFIEERSAGLVVFYQDEGKNRYYVILCHSNGLHWGFAKGNIEANEDEKETAQRETAEELGLTEIEIIPGFREEVSYRFYRGKYPVVKKVIFFLGRTFTTEYRLSAEHIDYRLLPFDAALKQITYKESRAVLRRAEEFLRLREERSHKP
ncbi:NUDIX domain-containing protein [Candidatus Acetothermia bacterium]|nr:NUDIX domain-containing protein [Candidatus Acetothermia bacterium]